MSYSQDTDLDPAAWNLQLWAKLTGLSKALEDEEAAHQCGQGMKGSMEEKVWPQGCVCPPKNQPEPRSKLLDIGYITILC